MPLPLENLAAEAICKAVDKYRAGELSAVQLLSRVLEYARAAIHF